MGDKPQSLQVVLFPLLAAGHMIPTLDIAKLFATNNVKTTILTTPLNAPIFTKALQSTTYNNPSSLPMIDVEIVPFPSKEGGIPEGIENCDQISCNELSIKFFKATQLLQKSLEQVMEKYKPSCLVADLMYPFATDVAAKFNVPRLVFHGSSYFAFCVEHALMKYEPQKSVSCDDEEFVVPELPHEIRLTRTQLVAAVKELGMEEWMKIYGRAMEAEERSYGIIVNSFLELEPDYVDYYTKVMGKRAWHIGPVSLCNREKEAKFQRGKDSSIGEHECLKWLDSKKPKSVVYVCFGSIAEVSTLQLQEIARGLEASKQDFIWAVRRSDNDEVEKNEEWLPHEFEKRMEGKGLIIRGWAPQMLILDHEAIGAFVTHCGWNSTLEGISCGVPMVTWPVFAEQFYNEKLVTQVLKTGVGVGAKKWSRIAENVKSEDVKKAITKVMVGEEALEIRSRAKKMKELARKAVEVGGSSYCDLNSLIQELSSYNARIIA
ncbi:scopoletin glucosyltransferase-like [Chenopodium quinoa]|uniref:Glycosyltransferase n=1 Tax=Chenopodium quinoa TaxID=63459 RepID=A0A803L7H8_CHEQI|nr:scopoletin glucosyltransferase-like [Chenopodium quinoa]